MSSNMTSSIILGEASETDSDDESKPSTIKNIVSAPNMKASIQGEIVTGEDSESDIDLNTSTVSVDLGQSRKSKDNFKAPTVSSSPDKVRKKYNSLLHKKLRENNTLIYKNMNNFFTTTIAEATTSLNGTDRQLMKSQLTLQAALNSLKNLNRNSVAIKNRLTDVVDANFLQNLVLTKK